MEQPSDFPFEQGSMLSPGDGDTFGVPCNLNNDCKKSSWCCSGGKCVPGSTCFQGSKLYGDFCDYGFECLTRCCDQEKKYCSAFQACATECIVNTDCSSQCCSNGYCSSKDICNGGKIIGDSCDIDSECQSLVCSKDLTNQANLMASNKSMSLSAEDYQTYDLGICMEQRLN